MCKCLLPASFEIDHIRPLHWGGVNARTNLQALCGTCHNEKTFKERQQDTHWECYPEDRPTQAFCMRCEECFSPYFIHECTNVAVFDESNFNSRLYDYAIKQIHRGKKHV